MMVWFGLEGAFKDHLTPTSLPWAGTFFTRSSSNLALNTFRDGASTVSVSNLCPCLTTLKENNFFLIPKINPPSFSLKSLPLCSPITTYPCEIFLSNFLVAFFSNEASCHFSSQCFSPQHCSISPNILFAGNCSPSHSRFLLTDPLGWISLKGHWTISICKDTDICKVYFRTIWLQWKAGV